VKYFGLANQSIKPLCHHSPQQLNKLKNLIYLKVGVGKNLNF